MKWTQIVGYVGVILLLAAYLCVTNKVLAPEGALYNLMNLVGVLGVGINVFVQKAWPSVVLQIAWGLIAIIALIRLM